MAVATAPRRRTLGSLSRSSTGDLLRHLDLPLVGAAIAIALLGVVMVYSATRGDADGGFTTYFLQRQGLFVLGGIGLMLGIAVADYRHARDWAVPVAGITLFLLLAVLTPLGAERGGSQSWFEFAGFQLQPSEFAQIALIIGLATFLTFERAGIDRHRLLLALGMAAAPMALIMLQPDLGTVLVFAAITLGMLLVAGVRPRHLAVLALVAIVGGIGLLNSNLLAEYQVDRLTSFVSPDDDVEQETYNLNQSRIAIASGGTSGKGLFNGTQTSGGFVPEQHTDFIFTVVGEELGFIGAAGLLGLYLVVIWRIWRIAQLSRDAFGTIVCVGVMSMMLFQIFQNIGMTIGIMPITGLPLPLMSYGGSSVLTSFAAIGLVLSVQLRRFS